MESWFIVERSAALSRLHFALTTPLLVLCIVTLAVRFYLRIRPSWKVGFDDWCILIGMIFAIIDWAMLTPEMITKAGPIPFGRAVYAIKYAYIAIPFWACSVAWTKIGVCVTLLRIRSTPYWNNFLYVLIGLQVIFQIGVLLFTLLQCRPLEAAWLGVFPGSQCLSTHALSLLVTTAAALNIMTDILVSLAPIRFLVTLHRPIGERLLVAGLMSLGLMASAISIRKTVLVQHWGDDKADMWNQGVAIGTLVISEQLVGSFAASAVCLKAALRRSLAHFGIVLDSQTSSFIIGSLNIDDVETLDKESKTPRFGTSILWSSRTSKSSGNNLSVDASAR